MRIISEIHIHCSDSDMPEHDSIDIIRRWHIKDRGWNDVGYHYFIRKNGTHEIGRRLATIPASIRGHNNYAVAICLHGRLEFTIDQFDACAQICQNIVDLFNLNIGDIYPHNYFDKNKTCPNFEIEKITNRMKRLRLV